MGQNPFEPERERPSAECRTWQDVGEAASSVQSRPAYDGRGCLSPAGRSFRETTLLVVPWGSDMGCGSIVIAQPEIIVLIADHGFDQADFACSARLLTSPEQGLILQT